ncbi:MAG: BatA domain-containing protein [Planctomycetales bacterium]|nr:BatA domain-containing protein [Planctomycetales bacterium]
MGLLAPLYALAALAVVGPIVFHLIRRQPQGQIQFSSLMFLSPSPPRLTRRSRLDNLLLLLLRALAIVLIALAFARPYLRQASLLNSPLGGRHIAIVMDTSGSMQRSDVWEGSLREASRLLDSLSPDDHVALYTLAAELQPVVALEDEAIADAGTSQQVVRAALASLTPTWQRTRLATGLKALADQLSAATIQGKVDPAADNELVLITDLHSESELESLQGYPWPEELRLDVRRILPTLPGNARVSLMRPSEDDAEDDVDSGRQEEEVVRVRVENNANSTEQSFDLTWATASGPLAGAATSVQVPAGQVRVLPLPTRPPGGDRVMLQGDGWDADNQAYVIQPSSTVQQIAYVGSTPARIEDDLSYFLSQAPLGTDLVRREIVKPKIGPELHGLLGQSSTEAVVVECVPDITAHASVLRGFAERGGTVLVCLSRPCEKPGADASFLDSLLQVSGIGISEADNDDFALLSSIDFRHPVFLPFADPRFNDFGKIRFWSHRRLQLPADSDLQVVASLDDGSPLLVERAMGRGRVWLMTSGWQPAASSLGLSSKFLPILMGMLAPSGSPSQAQWSYEVGDAIEVAEFDNLIVTDALDRELDERHVEREANWVKVLQPGLYWLKDDNRARQIAVQLPASESRLVPLDVDVLEQYGVPLGKVSTHVERRETQRQKQVQELEGQQRLWQWLLAAGMVLIALETLLAGWSARQIVH